MARPRQISDEQILLATRRRVLEAGPSVSLDLIAAELGVTQPALLKRFGSRHALLLAALRPAEEPAWLSTAERGPDRRPLEEQLLELFSALDAFFGEMLPCMTALRESGIPHQEVMANRPGPLRGLRTLEGWLERGADTGVCRKVETESTAMAMLGSVQSRVLYTHLIKGIPTRCSREGFLESISALYASALAPAPTSRRLPRPRPGTRRRPKV